MALQKHIREMLDSMPAGYYPVKAGPMFPDDLVYDWTSCGWLRNDSPEWKSKAEDAADCVGVIRRAALKMPGATVRNYRMPSERFRLDRTPPPAATIATPKKALKDLQASLF